MAEKYDKTPLWHGSWSKIAMKIEKIGDVVRWVTILAVWIAAYLLLSELMI